MGELANEAKRRSPFLQVEDEATVLATYKGFKMVPSSYDPTKENFRFIFTTEFGDKFLDTGSTKVAMVLDSVEVGGQVKITKHIKTEGGNKKSDWAVEAVMPDKIVGDDIDFSGKEPKVIKK